MVRFSDIIKIRDNETPDGISGDPIIKKEKPLSTDSGSPGTGEEGVVQPDLRTRDVAGIEIITYYERFLERIQDIRERVKGDQGISPSPILSDLHHIIDNGLIDDLYEYAMSLVEDNGDMQVHTIDVTFTCLKIGKGMDYDLKNLLRLGLAAFLENVGMYRIPEDILKNKGRLSSKDRELIRRHPEFSHEILDRIGERYEWLADVAVQVHERSDGSGYPSGLKGEEILEFASIIGLVDTYISMIKNRPYREKFLQTDAIKSILETSKGLFPHRIIKTFLNQISLFPFNSYIKLNNGSIGRVISTDKDQPLRPTIELLYDGSGNRLKEKQVIRLSENPLLYIGGSIKAKTLQ